MTLNGTWKEISRQNQLEFGKVLGFSEELINHIKKLEVTVKYTVTADVLDIDYTYTNKGLSINNQ